MLHEPFVYLEQVGGEALDSLVYQALLEHAPSELLDSFREDLLNGTFAPSRSYDQGMKIISHYEMELRPESENWSAGIVFPDLELNWYPGKDILEAGLRAFVGYTFQSLSKVPAPLGIALLWEIRKTASLASARLNAALREASAADLSRAASEGRNEQRAIEINRIINTCPSPSTNPSLGWLLAEHLGMQVKASQKTVICGREVVVGSDALDAVMRCYLTCLLGSEVAVPVAMTADD